MSEKKSNIDKYFHTLLESTPTGVISIDRAGKVGFLSTAYTTITGYRLEDFYNNDLDFDKTIHRDDLEEVKKLRHELKEGKKVLGVEHRVVKKDGSTVWVSVYASPVFSDTGDYLGHIVSLQDITQRKKAEMELFEAKKNFKAIAAYAWEYWISPSEKMLYVPPSCERISGYSPEEFLEDRKLMLSIIHPEHIRSILRASEARTANQ